MFSGYELLVIKNWAVTGMEILQGHLQSAIFTPAEKEDKRREYAALESLIEEARSLLEEYVSVDPDHMGHMLCVCDEYKHLMREKCEDGVLSTEEYACECYQIGYMQGRLELGLLTEKDISVIEEWEDCLE